MNHIIEPYLTLEDVKDITGLGESCIRKNMNRGRLRFFKIGRALRFRAEDVRAWVEGREQIAA